MMSYDASIWLPAESRHGKTYVSIPTEHPKTWKRRTAGLGWLVYTSGQYTITREPYGVNGCSYVVKRNGHRLFGLYARLKDAKAHAERNAAGQEIVNVA
jgi:hypothetical protein